MAENQKKPLKPYDAKAHLSARRAIKESKEPPPSVNVSFQILRALHKISRNRNK